MRTSLAGQTSQKTSSNPDLDALKSEAEERDLQALNAEIPAPLHKEAKRHALENDLYLRDVLIRALRQFLD
jgi:hypothetical protein